jgi:PIN domain nuclease of toxin-antitoxin system
MVPMSCETAIATGLFSLSELPDPINRIIVATPAQHSMPLVCADERVRRCLLVKAIW